MYNISNDSQTQTLIEKYPVISTFMDSCHGSGIDYSWSGHEDKNNIILRNSFHVMDDCGMYCAVCDFSVVIPKMDMLNFLLKCHSNRYYWNRNMLSDMLSEDIHYQLSEAIKKHNTGMPYKDGLREVTVYHAVPVRVI